MAKVKKGHGEHGLPMTAGEYKVRGFVTGTLNKNFFKVSTQKNGFERNTVNFGVKTSPSNEVYVSISDSEKDIAYFYKKSETKGEKGEVKKVEWDKRFDFDEKGFNIIGANIGLEKDEKGKNVISSFTDYDAAEYLSDLLKDDEPVLVMGDIDFSSSISEKDGIIRYKKFQIKKIYNSNLDFEDEKFVEENYFKQKCLFISIDLAKKDGVVDKEDPRWLMSVKVVTYKGLEDVEFVIRNKRLGTEIKKRIKPYNCIECYGKINNSRQEEEVQVETDDWGGESDPFEKVYSPRKFELEVVGLDTKNIDTTTYTEEIVTEAFKAKEEYGKDSDDVIEEGALEENWGEDDDIPW